MQLMLCHLLVILSLFYTSLGIKEGCADWEISGRNVCCKHCHPGNRLVESCGSEPVELCKPCDPGYFVSSTTQKVCDRCNQCTGIQVVRKNCSASSDTVCGCKTGLRCGNLQCSFCVDECGKGQEPTEDRTCRKCPNGTFNDKIHSKCIPWRTSCPQGEKFVAEGDKFRDIECRKLEEAPDLIPKTENSPVDILQTKKNPEVDSFWPFIWIAGGVSALTVFILSLWCAQQRTKSKTKTETKDPMPEMDPPELKFIMVEQDDACSYRQPEQEQGGSSESLSTQDSETKLIV